MSSTPTVADLVAAIAEIKRVTPVDNPWTAEDIWAGDYEPADIDSTIATILNAVVSGALSPAATEPVSVEPLKWEEYWAGRDEDIPAWRGRNSLGLGVYFSFSGKLLDGKIIETFDQAPDEWIEAAKAEAQAKFEKRVLSALTSASAPVTVEAAAKVLLADDVAISRMAKAVHDGPLGADDHWFSAARPKGAWCVDVVRSALRALAGEKRDG